MPRKTLTPKQEVFCREIVSGKDQSDAYRTAYKPKKAKDKSIHEMACALMKNPKVISRIQELTVPIVQAIQMSRVEWLTRIERAVRADVRKMYDKMGNPLEITELPDNEAAAIAGFEFEENFIGKKGEERIAAGYTKKFKLVDPLKCLELLGKANGWFPKGDEEDKDPNKARKSIAIVFVSSDGKQIAPVVVNPPTRKIEFVSSR